MFLIDPRFMFAARHPVLVRTPEERFTEAGLEDLGYNFQSNYIELPFGGGQRAVF
jgi:hypothetical protein